MQTTRSVVLAIEQANMQHLPMLTLLFNEYRQSHGRKSEALAVKDFLGDCLKDSNQSIFIATKGEEVLGFLITRLSRAMLSMKKVIEVTALYIANDHRRRRLASELINHAKAYAKNNGAVRLELVVSKSNYLAKGFLKKVAAESDPEFDHYWLFV